jgi:ferrous iron transport protein A
MSHLADLAAAGAPLDTLPNGVEHVVVQVGAPPGAPHWAAWLQELGFLPGEPVSVRARGLPGGEPLVVRVGSSTFALRRAEAACIRVVPR